MKQQHAGFTLIELVIVIVILGILAASAMPRFSELSADARNASLQGLAGSLRSGAAIARATQIAKGLASTAAVTMDGNTIAMSNGYPTAATVSATLTDVSGYNFSAVGNDATFSLRSNCQTVYTQSTGSGFSITITSTGC